MPLSAEQTAALKSAATAVEFQEMNPKKPGTEAWERYEKYKSAKTIQAATSQGAQWPDLSADLDKGYLTLPG